MSINKACQLLGRARSTFFAVQKNKSIKATKDNLVEQYILEKVNEIRKEMPRTGGKKLYFLINQDANRCDYKFGEKRFFDILRKHNLLVKKRKKYAITTDSKLWRGQFDNLLEGMSITRPEQVFVADITYFRTPEGFIYGHLITDAYSKKIMGFVVANDMKATTTLLALKMALKNRQYNEPLIHHSDRGYQYLSEVYTRHLKKNKIQISVTQNGSPYDNPVAERINGILKDEFGFGKTIKDIHQAKKMLEKALLVYNDKRPHWSNQFLTPNQMHNQRKQKMKTWEREIDEV